MNHLLSYLYLNSFNTQPPEGGWLVLKKRGFYERGFNTQPPEGGWVQLLKRLPIL